MPFTLIQYISDKCRHEESPQHLHGYMFHVSEHKNIYKNNLGGLLNKLNVSMEENFV
jgi:lipid II:glycine glycyltransferase (peptidoglycan interpeptide bridge formation enzyme)